MPLIAFTRNNSDHSNNTGFQFEFFCDKCGNGHMSAFKPNKVGMAGEFMRAAGSLFGGVFGSAATASDHVKDALRGGARDDAFNEAVNEAKQKFKLCTRCGHWVCPENCWNASRGQCKGCAPDLQEEATSAQAQVAKNQVMEKAALTDQTGGLDMSKEQTSLCPHCGAKATAGKFCTECGKPYHASGECSKCKAKIQPGAKFCTECGEKQ